MNTKKTTLIHLVALVLVLSLVTPLGARAAVAETVQPCASLYLQSYNAYIYAAGSGKIQVWFTVKGTDYMDTIGALAIQLYESTDNSNWTWVKAYSHTYYPDLIGYDAIYHSGHVDYQGVAGRYYRAYVSIWAGENNEGDNRYFYTASKKAT